MAQALADQYLTTNEVADLLHVTTNTLLTWRKKAGKGPAFARVGAKVLYRAVDVETWLEARRQSVAS